MALVVHNLHNRKNLQKQISFICDKVPRTEPAPLHVDYRTTLVEAKLLLKIKLVIFGKKIHKITDPVELKSMKTLLIKYLFLSMQEN